MKLLLYIGLLLLTANAQTKPKCADDGPWQVYEHRCWNIGSYGGTFRKLFYQTFDECREYCDHTNNVKPCTMFDWKPKESKSGRGGGGCYIAWAVNTYKTTYKAKGALKSVTNCYAYEKVTNCNTPTQHPTDTPRPTPPPVPPTNTPTLGKSKAPTTKWKPTPEPTGKPTSAKEAVDAYGEMDDQKMYRKGTLGYTGDTRNLCDTYEDVHGKEHGIEDAVNIIGGCSYDDEIRSVVLKRPGDSWVFTTQTPKEAYAAMVKFVRAQSPVIDDNHPIGFSYTVKSRDGQSRTLAVNDNMSLHAAFLLQDMYPWVELVMSIATTAPSAQPTTGHPSSSPTTAKPTVAITSKIINGTDDLKFLNGAVNTKVKNVKLARTACYTMSIHGKSQSTWRKNCGNGKGPNVFIIKTKNNRIFGGFYDLSWTDTGGGYFKNVNSFMWILKGRTYARKIMYQYRYQQYAGYHHSSYGPCFGGGHDLCINSPSSPSGYANSGYTYKAPSGGYPYYIDVSSGSGFTIVEWESFPVVSTLRFDSRILTSLEDQKWVEEQMPKGKVLGPRCYGMKYGLGEQSKGSTAYFRNSCSARGPIMLVVQESSNSSGKYIFGGYSGISWSKSSSGYAKSDTAYLWILKDRAYEKKVLPQYRYQQYATYHNTSYGPCFGGGHDLCISSPSTPKGYANSGYTYKAPNAKYPYYWASSSTNAWNIMNWEVFLAITPDERVKWRGF